MADLGKTGAGYSEHLEDWVNDCVIVMGGVYEGVRTVSMTAYGRRASKGTPIVTAADSVDGGREARRFGFPLGLLACLLSSAFESEGRWKSSGE